MHLFHKKKSVKGLKSTPVVPTQEQYSLNISNSPLFNRRTTARAERTRASSLDRLESTSEKVTVSYSSSLRLTPKESAALRQQAVQKTTTLPVQEQVKRKKDTPQTDIQGSAFTIGDGSASARKFTSPSSPLYSDVYQPSLRSNSSSSLSSSLSNAPYQHQGNSGNRPHVPLAPTSSGESTNYILRNPNGQKQVRNSTTSRTSFAVVFKSASELMKSSSIESDDSPTYEVLSPKKVVTRSVSVTPHPPVNPVDIRSLENSSVIEHNSLIQIPSHGETMSSKQMTAIPSVPAKQLRPLPAPPTESFQQLVHVDDQVDSSFNRGSDLPSQEPTYQTVNKISRVSRNTDRDRHSIPWQTAADLIESHATNGQEQQWTPADNVSLSSVEIKEPEQWIRPGSSEHFSRFKQRNISALSMLPEEQIKKLYRERFTRRVNLKEVLFEEPPDFAPPPLGIDEFTYK